MKAQVCNNKLSHDWLGDINYDIVPRVIKLISPHNSCDNLYLSHTCAFIRLITGGHKNDMSP